MSCWAGSLKSTRCGLESGVLAPERAESPAGHVRGELVLAEVEDRAPELEDAADCAHAHVPVLVQPPDKLRPECSRVW